MSWSEFLQWLLSVFIYLMDIHDEPFLSQVLRLKQSTKHTESDLMDVVLEKRNSDLEHAQVSVGSVAFLFLLQQITRDLEALKITGLLSHSSGGQKSKMSSAGLNSDASRTGLFLGLPGLCHLLVAPCGSFIHFQSRSFNFISFIWYTAPF